MPLALKSATPCLAVGDRGSLKFLLSKVGEEDVGDVWAELPAAAITQTTSYDHDKSSYFCSMHYTLRQVV